MSLIKNLNLPSLIDMLSEFTSHYASMLAPNYDKEEFEHCKYTIRSIQREISLRTSPAFTNLDKLSEKLKANAVKNNKLSFEI